MTLTLNDLRNALAQLDRLPGTTLVVMAKDGEGDGFSPLEELSEGMYLADSTFSGGHYLTEGQRRRRRRIRTTTPPRRRMRRKPSSSGPSTNNGKGEGTS